MSKRNSDASDRKIRQLIYVRDKNRCRWCYEPVRFKDMILAHGIAHVEAPTLDQIDNWFTCCSDCNKVNRHSAPPRPIPLEEASVPQLQATNDLLQEISGVLKKIAEPKPKVKPPRTFEGTAEEMLRRPPEGYVPAAAEYYAKERAARAESWAQKVMSEPPLINRINWNDPESKVPPVKEIEFLTGSELVETSYDPIRRFEDEEQWK